ncbi:ABC transporter permease [Streptomyces tibetensis]|uniref:ABC transporter permease n=1 Tax=Streptomyces tibetensis TaxID=2382123 RepID=UPI0033E32F00
MISLATARERWTSFLGSFVAVVLGVAVLTMSALVLLSDGPQVPRRLAGAPVLVQSPAGEPTGGVFTQNPPWAPERAERLRRELGRLPGVEAAVADRSFYAQAAGTDQRVGERQGHPWSTVALAAYGLDAGRAPATSGEIVLDESLGHGPGERVTVLTARGPQRFTVSGTTDGPGYYVTDRRAAELVGGIRAIGLVLGPDADPERVAGAARRVVGGDGTVLTGDARDALAPKQDEMTRWIGGQVLTAMALLSAFVTVFNVSSTFAFAVAQRRREFGLLRTIGATPRQVKRLVYGEALLVGVVGAAAGAVAGVTLAPAMTGLLIDAGFQPTGFEVSIRWWVPAAAWALGVATALAGAGAASRRASLVKPLEAMREAAVDTRPMTRRRWGAGLVTTGLGAVCSVGTAFAGADAMVLLALGAAMSLTAGLTLLLPALTGPVIGTLTRPLARRSGATGVLVRENMITAVRRTSATIAPVLATVAFAVLITSAVQTTQSADTTRQAAAVRAEAAVVPHGMPGLSDAAVAGVEGTALLSTAVYGGEGAVALSAAGVAPGFEQVHGTRAPRGNTVVVTRSVAAAHGWGKGRTVPLTFEDGRSGRLRVTAVVDDTMPYQVLLPREVVRAHDPSALADVAYRTGAGTAPLPARLGAREVSVAAHAASADAEDDRLVRVFTLILVAVTAGYTMIAVASLVLTATAGRVRDLRVLRLSGATQRQVLLTLVTETCCAVALGAALGLAVAAPALFGIAHGLRRELGLPVELSVAWPWVAGVVAGCLLLATTATALPARAVLNRMGRT